MFSSNPKSVRSPLSTGSVRSVVFILITIGETFGKDNIRVDYYFSRKDKLKIFLN